MSWKSAVAKFLVQSIGQSTLSSAGTQIGEAIGKRIGAKIYTSPEQPKADAKQDGAKP